MKYLLVAIMLVAGCGGVAPEPEPAMCGYCRGPAVPRAGREPDCLGEWVEAPCAPVSLQVVP